MLHFSIPPTHQQQTVGGLDQIELKRARTSPLEGRNAQKIIRLTTPTPFPHQVVKRITNSEHYFPTNTLSQERPGHSSHKPLVQDLVGTLVPAPPPRRRSFSFALHRDSALSLPCSFTGQQQQHLRRQVGGPQCPEFFSAARGAVYQ